MGAPGDLVERQLLALRLVDEVLRVGVQRRDSRVRRLRAGLVARDVAVDGRDLEAADGADHLFRARLVLREQPGQIADEVAGLLLLEEETADVLRLPFQLRLRVVDDREVDVGIAGGHLLERPGHQEADGDHEVVVLLRERGHVRDVVRLGLRDHDAPVDAELELRPLEPLVREEVEGAVVQAADVGDEADLHPLAGRAARTAGRRRRGRLRSCGVRGALVVAAAAAEREQQHEERQEAGELHARSDTGRGGIETPPLPSSNRRA